MNLPRVLAGVLVRSAVLALVIAAYGAAVNRSESTDALGAGLLAFLLVVVVAFGWAFVDGLRHGFVPALVTWVLTAALGGVAICVALALTVADEGVGSAIADSAVFFAVLLVVPALVGLGLGAVVHRVRGRAVTPA